jgi:O-methyltransferase involved in polyketide biosynthesis
LTQFADPPYGFTMSNQEPEVQVDAAKISIIAHFTAYVWYKLGFPEAERFITPQGRALYIASQPFLVLTRLLGFKNFLDVLLAYRHRVMDRLLAESGIKRVVEIGAGLSPRGIALVKQNPDVYYVEVDLPGISALKDERLGDDRSERHKVVGADVVKEDFLATVGPLLGGDGPVAVIAEGLTSYLPRPELEALLNNVRQFIAHSGGGLFLCDVYPKEGIEGGGLAANLFFRLVWFLSRNPPPLPFVNREDAHDLLTATGFEEVEVLDLKEGDTETRGGVFVATGQVSPVDK